MNDFATILIYLLVIVLLFLSLVIKKKLHYALSGLILITLGLLPFLYNHNIITFDLSELAIINYIAYFFVIFASRDLFKEAFKEEKAALKIPTLFFAIFLIVFTTIPTLNNMNVLLIEIPDYPDIINNIIYILSGIFLIIGMFALVKEE